MTIGPSLESWREQKAEMDELLGEIDESRLGKHGRNFPQEIIELAESILDRRPIYMAREDVWQPALTAVVAELLKEREALREEIQELESRYYNLIADIGGTSPG
jgi:uncharacterized coiled-coil DUF342 family protein